MKKKSFPALLLALTLLLGAVPFGFAEETAEPIFLEEADAVIEEEHPAYFFAEDNGLYYPERALTRRELAVAVYELLGEINYGRVSYSDVSVRAVYAPAARLMKELGLIRSEKFQAERTVTKGELIEILQTLYPVADLPELVEETLQLRDEEVSRAEAAMLINRFSGRVPNEKRIDRLFSIVPDFNKENEYYYDFAEAVLTHTAERGEDGSENWTGHAKYTRWEKGLVRVDGQLRYLGREGTFVHGETVDGFMFDENGNYTSGLPELDALITEILAENVDPAEEELEQLHAAYLYVIHIGQYRKGNTYAPGETGWSAEEAYSMLSTGYGNCYSYAAAFAELARALGFEAKACSGYVVGGQSGMTPHGWVEVRYEGTDYVCDPELQDVKLENLFMMEIGTPNCDRWQYTQEEIFGEEAAQ